jgi:regulator of protease activity HflC (stomatin/prohibitin superfamily)
VSEAGQVRAEAESEAMQIYAEAYGANEEFYSYWAPCRRWKAR